MKEIHPPKKYLKSLQTVRALAFLGVFVHHTNLIHLGTWGVSVFFVLSGFLMMYSYYGKSLSIRVKDAAKFSASKIKKLYPLHLALVMISLIFVAHDLLEEHVASSILLAAMKVIASALLVQAWIPQSAFYYACNGVAWYLSVCFFLYFAFPLILKCIQRYHTQKEAVVAAFTIATLQLLICIVAQAINSRLSVDTSFLEWTTYICPINRLGDFAIGCNLGYLFLHDLHQPRKVISTALEMFALLGNFFAIYLALRTNDAYGENAYTYAIVYLPTTCLLVYVFAKGQGHISEMLTNRATTYLAVVSADAFLIHQTVITFVELLCFRVAGLPRSAWALSTVAFVLVLAACQLCKTIRKAAFQRKSEQISGG